MRDLHTEPVRLGDLHPHPENSNSGDVATVRESLRRWGQWRPVVAQRRPDGTLRVLIGHTMLRAAQAERWDRLHTHIREVDDDEARRILALDNRSRDLAQTDDSALLRLLDAFGDDLTGTGFVEDDREGLRALVEAEQTTTLRALAEVARGEQRPEPDDEAPPPGLPDSIDEVPEPPAEPTTRVGDVWHLGPHRLVCGDCTNPAAVRALGVEAFDLILTDPPYCSGGFQETAKGQGSVGTKAAHKQIANDRLSTRGYLALMRAMLNNAPAAFAYVFTDWRMWVYLFDVVESSGFGVRSMIVGDKGTAGMGRGWRAQHELIMWGAKATPPYPDRFGGAGNVLPWKRTGNLLHTTQKPVDLLVRLIENTPFARTVYDPFAGSGSTLMACHETGRTAYMLELDPAYCDVIAARWTEHTGQEARRIPREQLEQPAEPAPPTVVAFTG